MSYLTQSLHRLMRHSGTATATIDGSRLRDWRQVGQAVRRFAGALHAAGLQPGDPVGFLARNCDYYLDFLFGTVWAGGVIQPVNTRWAAAEIAYALEDSATRLLIVHGDFAEMIPAIRALAPGLSAVVQIGGTPAADIVDYETWLAAGQPVEDLRRSGSELAALLYTGGTTGRPKGVMLSHDNLVASALGSLCFSSPKPGARYLHTAPLFHVGALAGMLAALLAGSTQVFLGAFEPGAVLDIMEHERITDVFLVPTMMRALLLDPGFAAGRVAHLQRIIYGASAIDDALMDEMLRAFPQVGFVQAYGMTELSPIVTMLGPADHSAEARAQGRGRSAGRATAVAEVRIVDSHDVELPCGELGEIVARGDNVMLGYWGLPDETAAALRGGWMHTGDIGHMDANGYVTVVDRLKDVIITGGENVYSAEVENALTAHPAVLQAAVIAVPDAHWGEAVHAVIVARHGADCDAATLRDHCRTLIAGYKVPKSVEFVGTLPLSPAGKVLKTELRTRAQRILATGG